MLRGAVRFLAGAFTAWAYDFLRVGCSFELRGRGEVLHCECRGLGGGCGCGSSCELSTEGGDVSKRLDEKERWWSCPPCAISMSVMKTASVTGWNALARKGCQLPVRVCSWRFQPQALKRHVFGLGRGALLALSGCLTVGGSWPCWVWQRVVLWSQVARVGSVPGVAQGRASHEEGRVVGVSGAKKAPLVW